jgi:hypothetical protein
VAVCDCGEHRLRWRDWAAAHSIWPKVRQLCPRKLPYFAMREIDGSGQSTKSLRDSPLRGGQAERP